MILLRYRVDRTDKTTNIPTRGKCRPFLSSLLQVTRDPSQGKREEVLSTIRKKEGVKLVI